MTRRTSGQRHPDLFNATLLPVPDAYYTLLQWRESTLLYLYLICDFPSTHTESANYLAVSHE